MKTINEAGQETNYENLDGDVRSIEFRKPSGALVAHAGDYDGTTGTVSWDQGAAHSALLDEPGQWLYRGVLARADGNVIKTGWSPPFWVVP